MSSSPLEFLDAVVATSFDRSTPVNAFVVAGVAQHDAASAHVLAFLLDPAGRHGFGTTFVDALLMCLDGMPTDTGAGFVAADATGSSTWKTWVTRTSETPAGSVVMLDDDERGIAIAVRCSPTASARRAAAIPRPDSARATTMTAQLRVRATDRAGAGVPTVTFDDLFDAAAPALYEVGLLADQRSLELYAQFRETVSERIAIATVDHERRRIDEIWSAIADRQDQVLDFLGALDAVGDALVDRCVRLRRAVGERLDHLGVEHSTWIVDAGDHAAARRRGERVLARLGIDLDSGVVELLVGWLPRTGTFGYAVTAHQRRARSPRPWDHVPLGLPIDDDEQAVADRLVALVQRWRSGARPE